MKIMHLSDLHLGKRLNEFSLLEEQAYILKRILQIIDEEQPQAVIIAGDVYDKALPSAEAVSLFDDFLFAVARREKQVFVISGNHDSPERIAFGGRLMSQSGIHMSPVYNGTPAQVTLEDEFGKINFFMLPFIKPIHVRRFFPETDIDSYNDAVATALGAIKLDKHERNILITHQFVTGAQRSESEEMSVGGSENIDATLFAAFDYTALGHIHKAQNVGGKNIRYCGTPLKYSFSEAKHEKSLTMLELREKGDMEIYTVPLKPLHDLRKLKGSYEELTRKSFWENSARQDFLHITLTDEDEIVEAMNKLRVIYPNLMHLEYDNRRSRHRGELNMKTPQNDKDEYELFAEFYEKQNGSAPSDTQSQFCRALFASIKEAEQ